MPYIDCPRCHASFHTGAIYQQLESCPRCAQSFHIPRRTLRQQAWGIFSRRRTVIETPDWEQITSSQYNRQH
jgi:hypothetical protein